MGRAPAWGEDAELVAFGVGEDDPADVRLTGVRCPCADGAQALDPGAPGWRHPSRPARDGWASPRSTSVRRVPRQDPAARPRPCSGAPGGQAWPIGVLSSPRPVPAAPGRPGERRSTVSVPDPAPASTSIDNHAASAVTGPAGQRPNDVDLPSLLVDLLTAKDAVAHDSAPGRNHRPPPGRAKLLACMEAYSAALTARQLPIPPRLRDDLRLHRALYSPDADETARHPYPTA
jgi:hypothetical protein